MQTSKPKLGYWKIRGLAQQIRYVHVYLGVDFEDVMYETGDAPDFSRQDWLDIKPTLGFDFPNLPYYIDGDFKITESAAIIRYVANKYDPKLLGRTNEEKAHVDMINGPISDLKSAVIGQCYSTGDKEAIRAKVNAVLPAIVKYLGHKDFLVGDQVTYVDFIFFELLNLIDFALDGSFVKAHETLVHYVARIKALNGIQAYYDSPATQGLIFNNKMAKIGGAGSA